MSFLKRIGFILLILASSNTFGQKKVESLEDLLSPNKEFLNLDSTLVKFGLFKISEFEYKYGFKEQLYSYKNNGFKKSVKLAILKFTLKNERDNIVYYEIYEDYKEKYTYSSFIDSTSLKVLQKRFEKHGLSNLAVRKEMTYGKLDSDVLGFACGFSASRPYFGDLLVQIIKDQNMEELFSWLGSINPTKQAYGYIGIKVLTDSGEILSESQEFKLKVFENDEHGFNKYYYVNTCSGCIYGQSHSLKKLPETDFLKSMIKLYSSVE